MKNPLPTARQRFTGSLLTASVGAAALLASACSVGANAQETTISDQRVFSDKSGLVTIQTNGETRQMVLLTDPFEALGDLESNLLEFDIHIEGIDELVAGLDVELAALDGLAIAGDAMTLVASFTDDQLGEEIATFTSELAALVADGDFDEEAIEALTEAFDARMETWSENFEIEIDAASEDWEETFETRMEAWAETVEARAEALASRVEAQAENIEIQAEHIEAQSEQIERAGETVEDLAEQCEGKSGIRIVTVRKTEEGQTQSHKAVCLDHNSAEDATAILEELKTGGDLTPEEFARVEEALNHADGENKKVKIRIHKEKETSQ